MLNILEVPFRTPQGCWFMLGMLYYAILCCSILGGGMVWYNVMVLLQV